jgi:hypothetical protein
VDVPKATHVAAPLRAPLSVQDVADTLAAIEVTYRRPDSAGVCVADGFGVKVTVERGALQVHDGIGGDRQASALKSTIVVAALYWRPSPLPRGGLRRGMVG